MTSDTEAESTGSPVIAPRKLAENSTIRAASPFIRTLRTIYRAGACKAIRNREERRLKKRDDPSGLSPLKWRLDVWTTDTFLISFPKSGRTWLRLMLGRAFQNHYGIENPAFLEYIMNLEALTELDPRVPRFRVTHDHYPDWKTPDELEQPGARFRDSRVILLVRDPRDIVVSLYFEHAKRLTEKKARKLQASKTALQKLPSNRVKPYVGSIEEFIRDDIGSFDSIIRYFNLWVDNRRVPEGFVAVRYEDLHANPGRELRRIAEFVQRPDITDDSIAEAVEFAGFDNMRKMEERNELGSARLKPGDKDDKESYKTRRGKTGGFVDYLQPDDVEYLTDRMNSTLNPFFGYTPA